MLEPEQPCWISGWGATHEKGEALGHAGPTEPSTGLGSGGAGGLIPDLLPRDQITSATSLRLRASVSPSAKWGKKNPVPALPGTVSLLRHKGSNVCGNCFSKRRGRINARDVQAVRSRPLVANGLPRKPAVPSGGSGTVGSVRVGFHDPRWPAAGRWSCVRLPRRPREGGKLHSRGADPLSGLCYS